MELVRDNLTRDLPFELSRAAAEGDGLTLEGYAAVFNQQTTIDSWEGKFVEQLARGAFRQSLLERTPVIQFDHGRHPLVGSIPLGSIETLREDKTGLFVRARLHDNWLVEPVRDAIRSGAVDGMSFRFSVVKEQMTTPTKATELPVRTIQEVKLYELGPVVFPAYSGTTVGVRSRELATILNDPAVRADLARALLLPVEDAPEIDDLDEVDENCTRDEMSDSEGESIDERAAQHDPEPLSHSDTQITVRRARRLALAGITSKETT